MPERRPGPVRVKICGLTRAEDAGQAARAGADFVGAILSPGFSRSIDPTLAAGFPLEDGCRLVAVLVDADVGAAVEAARVSGASVLQLHGEESPAHLRALREEGDWELWKAARVRGPGDVEEAVARWADVADGLLLDGFAPGRRGGVGARFPWDAVAPVLDRLPAELALIAAGGLNPDNVAEAVRALRPDVVDVSSGVEERPGVKAPALVRSFVRRAGDAGGEDAQHRGGSRRAAGPAAHGRGAGT